MKAYLSLNRRESNRRRRIQDSNNELGNARKPRTAPIFACFRLFSYDDNICTFENFMFSTMHFTRISWNIN